nr:reverse transcriptase domain-containing protein [Tanacetum cinerariifolium]
MIKSSIDEPPEVELKDLPPHLEYAFLEGDNKLPVIIAKALRDEEKSALIKVLKSHKQAIAWKLSDIQEVEKLLDAGLIYPISDSLWVSPVHCVPKKGGFIVVANEENEFIPTRLVIGWRVCIDYKKLNEATRKDHFPLPFMDQMLERLARNEYYCFLNGFSGFGAPRAIISDRGTQFCNDQFEKVMRKYGVTHLLSIAYHPQTSGQVEGKLKSHWSGPFAIAKVFPYGTVELSQANGPNFKVNDHCIKHYFGGDVPQLIMLVSASAFAAVFLRLKGLKRHLSWHQSKILRRPPRKKLHYGFIQRQLKREKEARHINCIRQITHNCKNMLRRKLEEIELYNFTISQNINRKQKCYKCRQMGHIIKNCPMKKKEHVEGTKKPGNIGETATLANKEIMTAKPTVSLKYPE